MEDGVAAVCETARRSVSSMTNVRPISAASAVRQSAAARASGTATGGIGAQVIICPMGLVALAMLAEDAQRRACEAAGRRFRRSGDSGAEQALAVWLICHLDGDHPVLVDFRAIAVDNGWSPARMREAADWLAAVRAIAIDGEDEVGRLRVWVNPSLGHHPDTDPLRAATRHRFPRIWLDETCTPYRPVVEEFDDIVWVIRQRCHASLPEGGQCGWFADEGVCPQHATDAERAEEAAEHARLRDAARVRWRQELADRRRELAALRERPCPACSARAGQHCRTVSGGRSRQPHASR